LNERALSLRPCFLYSPHFMHFCGRYLSEFRQQVRHGGHFRSYKSLWHNDLRKLMRFQFHIDPFQGNDVEHSAIVLQLLPEQIWNG
jgi:hypothetical protein